MSQLRASTARSDRRESGGRHGRPGAGPLPDPGAQHPPALPAENRIRPQLLRAAVLPTVVATLGGVAVVLFTLRFAGTRPAVLWIALACSAAIVVSAVVAAALGADRASRTVLDRCHALRRAAARRQQDLLTAVGQLRRGEHPSARRTPPPAPGGDAFDLLDHELGRSHEAAVAAVVQASRLSSSVGNAQKVEVFANLARRLQSLVHREIQLLDELENQVEDPDLLKGLFHVDHLATRTRRHAENLAVLGGAVSRRQWSHPVTLTEVLRSSIAEVEQYPRVKLVPPVDGTLRGHAVADVIHLLAELVENATLFSAPHTSVLLRAQYVTSGLAVEVEDRGLGMPQAEQAKMNALLSDPDQVNVAHLLQDGRIGLYVVAALARRHGIAVRLQSNIYGGVQAVVIVPQGLLGTDPDNPRAPGRPQPPAETAPEAPDQAAYGQPDRSPTAYSGLEPAAHGAPQPEPVVYGEPEPATYGPPDPVPAAYGAETAGRGVPAPAGTPGPPLVPVPEPALRPAPPAGADAWPAGPRHAAPAAASPPPDPTAPGPAPAAATPPGIPHPATAPDSRTPPQAVPDEPTTWPGGNVQPAPRPLQPYAWTEAPEPYAADQWTGRPAPHSTVAAGPHPSGGHRAGQPGPCGADLLPGAGEPYRAGKPYPPDHAAGHAWPPPAEDGPYPADDHVDGPEHRPGGQEAGPPHPRHARRGGSGPDARPLLPKRRAQEHLAPQLRGGPARPPARDPAHDDEALHDPGLMAAFQRGIALAESMPAADLPAGPGAPPGTGTAPWRHDDTHEE